MSDRAAFEQEWKIVAGQTTQACLETLARLGMGEETLAYVKKFRGIPMFPYLSTVWVPDPELRKRLGVQCGVHVVGIKLVDDLLDADQPYPTWDLGLGVYLIQMSTCQLGQFANPAEVMACNERDFDTFWQAQYKEAQTPPTDKAEWLECAKTKSGLPMATYGEMACLAADVREAIEPSRIVGQCLGTLVMIADDLVDHIEQSQEDGNLGYFVKQGQVSANEVVEMVEDLRGAALQALRDVPPVHDISHVVNAYSDDVLDNYLPRYR